MRIRTRLITNLNIQQMRKQVPMLKLFFILLSTAMIWLAVHTPAAALLNSQESTAIQVRSEYAGINILTKHQQ